MRLFTPKTNIFASYLVASYVPFQLLALACTTSPLNISPPPCSPQLSPFSFPSLLPHLRSTYRTPFSASIQMFARSGNQGRVPRAMAGLYLWPRSTMACAIAPMGGADAAAAAPATAHAVASTASHLLILQITHPLSQHPCSDEPATGACSNSRFFCPNIGHQGTLIAVSRVNGGQYTRAVRHR